MARHTTSGIAADAETANRLNTLQQAIADIDTQVASISNPSNTIWQATEPTQLEMNTGYVYMWPDSNGEITVGGLDSDTGSKTIIDLNISAGSDGGLVGAIVGGLF